MALSTTHSSDGKIGPIVQGVLDVNGVAAPAVVDAVVIVDGTGAVVSGTAAQTAVPGTLVASSGNVANAAAVATLPAAAGKTTYITGFQMTATGATVASVVNATVTGLNGGTLTYTFAFPVGIAGAATPLIVTFANPIPASAVNTAIVVTLPAGGAANTNAAVNVQGYQL